MSFGLGHRRLIDYFNICECGCRYALQHLDLRDNVVEYLCELWILGGCSHLEEVVFECGGYTNPVCKESGYRSTLLSVLPSIHSLDGSSCMDHAPLSNTDISSSVPSLWAIHHSYPGHQNPVKPGPKIARVPYTCSVYQDTDAEGTGTSLPNGGQSERSNFRCKFDAESIPESSSCETCVYRPQGQLQKSDSRHILNHKCRGESYPYQAYCLEKTHDSHDYQMQSIAERVQEPDADYARLEPNHTIKPKDFQRGARRSVHTNAENLIVNASVEDCYVSPRKESSEHEVLNRRLGIPSLDFESQHPEAPVFKETFQGNGLLQVPCDTLNPRSKLKKKEELGNSISDAAGTDASRIVRFVGQNSTSELVTSLCLPRATVSGCCTVQYMFYKLRVLCFCCIQITLSC